MPEDIPECQRFYRDRRVLVTGHTGFKGSWLCEWLLMLGARVSGYSLEPDTEPSLFRQLGLADRIDHRIGDVRDRAAFANAVRVARPEVIFHLAAQPLVRRSYADPVTTYETNVMGTVHLLDILREWGGACAAVFVTSDKCYRNEGAGSRSFQEEDPMGGIDPYSSSKGCAELAIHSFRQSYFLNVENTGVRVASARAGNVIGGGDWAPDRIVPDCVRSLSADTPIRVRNRHAVRPWQHVLEPLRGYLMLGYYLFPEDGERRAEDGGRKTEDGSRRAEDGGRKTEDGSRRAEDGGRKTEAGSRRAEDGGRKAEDGVSAGKETGGSNQEQRTKNQEPFDTLKAGEQAQGQPTANNPSASSGPTDNQQPSSNKEQRTKNNEPYSFNFGPDEGSNRTVECVVREILKHWPGDWIDATAPAAPHEAGYLSLDSDRARRHLGWRPVWNFEETFEKTVSWYKSASSGRQDDLRRLTRTQISQYTADSISNLVRSRTTHFY